MSRRRDGATGRVRRTARGFTLIEALAALLIFGFLVSVFYRVFIEASAYMVNSRFLRGAVAAANERMEHYRNIPYAEIGTTVSAPVGAIVSDEIVAIDGLQYRIITSVFFVDDPHDGVAPDDTLFEDYKRVSVTVVWREAADAHVSADRAVHDAAFASRRIQLTSQFVPPGGRETTVSGGILHVNVLNSEGQPISDMPLDIYNADNDSHITIRTDAFGAMQYVGAPPCQGCYEITVGRAGYQTVHTESPPDDASFTPQYAHQSVIQGQRTTATILSDPVAHSTFACMDGVDAPMHNNILFAIEGGRVRGYTPSGTPVFFTHENFTTGADGTVVMRTDTNADGTITTEDDADPGVYTVQIPTIPAGYHLWKIDDKIPEGGKANVTIVPGEERTIPVIFIEQERAAVLATVTDADEPVHNATVRVRGEHDGVPVEVMGTTDVNGMVYLVPEEPTTFLPDTPYTLTVSADGYDEEEEQDITISALHEVSVTLEKS